jgi:AcrR family transcriptional regulator
MGPVTESTRPVGPSAAQSRVIASALDLFAQYGVGGTSLQMIADDIGVTKAAVYHQFRTKEEIVRAAAETELARVEVVLDQAERTAVSGSVRDAVVTGIIDLAIERRPQTAMLLNDPIIGRLFVKDDRLREVIDRLNRLLIGAGAGPDSRVATAMVMAAISGAVMHPLVAEVSDDILRAQLLHLARRFLNLPD